MMRHVLPILHTPPRRTHLAIWIIAGISTVVLVPLIFAAAFPASWLKSSAEKRISSQVGSAVRIGNIERETIFSLSPVINISDIQVPQPNWAGPGYLATIRNLRIRARMLPLLLGRGGIDILSAQGVRLSLIRDENRRVNWSSESSQGKSDKDGGLEIPATQVDDFVVDYRDAVQKRRFSLSLKVDPQQGLRGSGSGTVAEAPVEIRVIGAPMIAGQPWAFDARIEGEALSMHAAGVMAGPLRTGDMTLKMTARASDLKMIDYVIEAGLFGTQPVTLAADVRHRDNIWSLAGLSGTVGRSRLTGQLTAHKTDGRTKLNGQVRFSQLDFDDLADDRGRAKGLALELAEGRRIVPNTRVNIRKIRKTDGRIAIRVDHVLDGRRPAALTNLSAVLNLENRRLIVEPLRIGLKTGVITGKAIVDQREGQPDPMVTLALDMKDSSIATLAGGDQNSDGDIEGRVDAHVRLTGIGSTIREAVGNSNGTIGAVTRGGSMPSRLAGLIGFDIGKGLFGSSSTREALNCGVVRLDVKQGRGTANPIIVDTRISQTRGTGTVSFPTERLSLTLKGAAKNDHALQLPGSATLQGSIREPAIIIPEGTRSFGNVLKAVGRAIGGRAERAGDIDCRALIRHTLG